MRKDGAGISSLNPADYMARFNRFMREVIVEDILFNTSGSLEDCVIAGELVAVLIVIGPSGVGVTPDVLVGASETVWVKGAEIVASPDCVLSMDFVVVATRLGVSAVVTVLLAVSV